MRSPRIACIAGSLLLVGAATAQAQGHVHSEANAGAISEPAVASLMERVRLATARFHDRDAAARAGYRRVGVDFPAMGEHWVNPGLLIRRELDYDHPPILTYAAVNGVPALTGVVYAVALGPGESPPTVAGAERPWHEHNGSLTDEILVRPASNAQRTDRRRLAVLHLWTEVANPAGPFATDNWALPFVRLGFRAPESPPPDAARVLSLVASGERYFLEVVDGVGGATALATVRPVIAAARAEALALIAQSSGSEYVAEDVLAELTSVWRRMTSRVAQVCAACAEALVGH